jgi:hypothetical protein
VFWSLVWVVLLLAFLVAPLVVLAVELVQMWFVLAADLVALGL